MATETGISFALEITGEAWQPTGFYFCPLCGKQEPVNDFLACPNRLSPAGIRERLKGAIADLAKQLQKRRLRTKKSDIAAHKRLNRLEDTLTAYKRTLQQVEKSVETLARAESVLKSGMIEKS